MNATPKKKLCWNCEGRVSLHEENCPFCAVYLGPAPDENGERKDIFAPPYRIVESEEDDDSVPQPPYPANSSEKLEEVDEVLSESKTDLAHVVLPMSLLSSGVLFFMFGLVLWLFSTNGFLTLTWNGDYWYIYTLLSLPLIFIGWRSLKQADSSEA